MNTTWTQRIAGTADVAFIVVGLAVLGQFAWTRLHPAASPSLDREQFLKKGDAVAVAGFDWSGQEWTLVAALSRDCHFCSESAEFYRQLEATARSAGIKWVAVLPESQADGRQYLAGLKLNPDEVRQGLPQSLRVPGTPALLLVDKSGRAQEVWIGRLSSAREEQVKSRLRQVTVGSNCASCGPARM